MDYTDSLPDMPVRPLPGLHFNLFKDGKVDLCAKYRIQKPASNRRHG